MGDFSREESIFGFSGPVARIAGAASSTMYATLVCGGLAGNAWPEEIP